MDQKLADLPVKGRGAISNPKVRFDRLSTERVDDGWERPAGPNAPDASNAAPSAAPGGTAPAIAPEDELPPLRTTVTPDATRSVLVRQTSPDIPFDRSINPYRGCEHGCVYCFARPTHAYLGLSPGLDFETKLTVKLDAAKILTEELRKPGYAPAPIALGTNTDPYQPIEREYRVMRGILEVLSDFNHPVTIVTKSNLVTRDIDLLAPMAKKKLVRVALSVTTLEADVARAMEPRAPIPGRRLAAIRSLASAGIPVSVMTAPMIPGLNDWELERILEAAAQAGATGAGYVLLRMPHEIKDLFTEWLEAHFPGRAKHVLSLMKQSRGGKLYDAEWGKRFKGEGKIAETLGLRFRLATKRLGLNKGGWRLDTSQFQVPPRAGDQMKLL
jgi:DNA repair photolyase